MVSPLFRSLPRWLAWFPPSSPLHRPGAIVLSSLVSGGLVGSSLIHAVPSWGQTVSPGTPPLDRALPRGDSIVPRDAQPPSSQPLPETTPIQPLPPPSELLPPLPASGETFPSGPRTIVVKQFKVTGSTVFSQSEFDRVVAEFVDRPITLTELFQARSAITNFYIQKGYITSGAYIPPQTFNDGVVEIRVLEGSLQAINVTGTQRLNRGYVRSRIGIATQRPLQRERLLDALRLLQLDPRIQNLSAELSAGDRPGQSILDLRVVEAKTFDASLTLDNGRSPSVGTEQRKIQLREANLLGLGDSLSLSYTNTTGSNSFDVGYTLPVSPHNTTLSLSYGGSSSRVIEQPFNILEIESKSRYYELTLRHPFLQTPTQEFAIGVTGSWRQSQATFLEDLPFPASGADENGKTRVTAVRFFQEWTQRNSRQVFALRSQFSLGFNAFGSTINADAPDSRFFTWRGQAQWVRLLGPDTLLLLRGDVQLADRPLLGLEQFGLGGPETVRGYRQDSLLTDSGVLFSAEVRIPIVRFGRQQNLLQLTPFVDFGKAWNLGEQDDPATNTLASVGIGLRLQLANALTARLDWGIPLVEFSTDRQNLQERGIHFSIVASPLR
ncbi:ShlB/FhaC/HecB family hemolysin secretion/activation protein [Alkalinema sp. FACHB-956]|uniref:ShlB/FhaC/HecB family hemolysin secretion/activation protein n=1 Tax=Alkalinema sp. FACHB-956 TaxID=2692768 RepID=UPI001688C063|nr:ShlB/FhaC/HecB family hemolysin secretion/activation protein [Alkalinema sp. FACHB-956]MBD2328630.1 ShlB/FhaC/HecB family hemolysin secretion/activation protein [Alkalinema sp. FACHB-956]